MIFSHLGRITYSRGLSVQSIVIEKVQLGLLPNTVLVCEHYPVYTYGRRQNLETSSNLSNIADVAKTQRGGQTTFHGPGQLVVYPIVNLKSLRLGIKDFIYSLEDIVIGALRRQNIKGTRTVNNGVFVAERKIASVGVHVQRFVTSHGFSLNVQNSVLPWFERIVPCGLKDVKTDCLQNLLNHQVSLQDAEHHVIQSLMNTWNVSSLIPVHHRQLIV
eukprot:NODE_336_length_10675_cov_0.185136.p4 type:complete len:217 gc:universal NODE_336_length_10675_cov_0.185136:6837-6187(-)